MELDGLRFESIFSGDMDTPSLRAHIADAMSSMTTPMASGAGARATQAVAGAASRGYDARGRSMPATASVVTSDGMDAHMGFGSFGSLSAPSPSTAAFLDAIANGTPRGLR